MCFVLIMFKFPNKLIRYNKITRCLLCNAQPMRKILRVRSNGMSLFIGEGCTTCHVGPLLGGNMFQKFGKFGDYWEYTKSEKIDKGKFTVTGSETDMYVFKVPSLRNIEMTGPYIHDGSVADLSEVVRIMGKIQLDKDLTDQQIADIVAFLKTLTGAVPEKYQTAPSNS